MFIIQIYFRFFWRTAKRSFFRRCLSQSRNKYVCECVLSDMAEGAIRSGHIHMLGLTISTFPSFPFIKYTFFHMKQHRKVLIWVNSTQRQTTTVNDRVQLRIIQFHFGCFCCGEEHFFVIDIFFFFLPWIFAHSTFQHHTYVLLISNALFLRRILIHSVWDSNTIHVYFSVGGNRLI